ncbi:MAG: PAS domain S-box protein, partial [Flammeovirgaceae bacterium]|nr:PAS domain S-box protein [Flammeovirgaceae bacterium]MDW8288770.1 PAS domain S-box protein [Flammeovirgaceae bacterium]
QKRIIELSEQESERKWATEGLAMFVEILRNNTYEISELSYQIIYNLVKYLGAAQGGIFILSEKNKFEPCLEMLASYAYNRRKYLQKRIDLTLPYADGIVAQVFLEKETTYITDLPDDYLKITSGLGGANPRSLLVVPLKTNNVVYGVLEIASFKTFKPYQIEFVEKLSENIASTLAMVKTNEQTKELLLATQQQAEVLRTQEEELRQNLEELQAAQEELQRLNKELEYTFTVINNAMIVSEYNTKGEFLKVNQNFCRLFGYTPEELIGKHHSILVSEEDKKSREYLKMWEDLAQGKSIMGEFKRYSSKGHEIWLRGNYYPIKDVKGNIIRIIKLSYNITVEKEQEKRLQEKHQIIAENEKLLKERTKAIQDKAYQRIKQLKEDHAQVLAIKEAEIERLKLEIEKLKKKSS